MNTAKIEIVKIAAVDVVTTSGDCECFKGGVISPNAMEDDC